MRWSTRSTPRASAAMPNASRCPSPPNAYGARWRRTSGRRPSNGETARRFSLSAQSRDPAGHLGFPGNGAVGASRFVLEHPLALGEPGADLFHVHGGFQQLREHLRLLLAHVVVDRVGEREEAFT